MRERITKGSTGRNNSGRKEVRIRINRSGKDDSGVQRYSIAARFADESYKKITDKDYVVLEVDWELNRIYFLPGEPDEGFKLTGTGKTKSITFTRNDIERWDEIQGCYFLLKDPKEKSYYIDYSSKAKEDTAT